MIVLHSTAKFQKTNNPNSLYSSKSSSPRDRGAARRGLCQDKDTPQFATRCHSNSTLPAPTKADKTERSDLHSANADYTRWWVCNRQLLPLFSQHIQDQTKVPKKHSESQIKNHH